MFKYIAEILKSFTPAQRITALLILVFTIVIVTLGPSTIDRHTNTCDELNIRIASQEKQIIALTSQVEQLNSNLISGQSECTANLIQKQQEIMSIVNQMIDETQRTVNSKKVYERRIVHDEIVHDPNEPRMAYSVEPEPVQVQVPDGKEALTKLKQLKAKLQKTIVKQ